MSYKNAHRRTIAEEVRGTVMDWLNELATDFYDEEIVRLVQRLDKRLNYNEDYTDK
jgi:hypothetical protein